MTKKTRINTWTDAQRWRYFLRSARGLVDRNRRVCPNCGHGTFRIDKWKFFVTALARCTRCQIRYRIPTDLPTFNESFYQADYESGFTTDCPSESKLNEYLSSNFQGTPKDFRRWIEVLKSLGIQPGQRVLDLGASWGYGTWQFSAAGYRAIGYEISLPRARYARDMLKVDVRTAEQQVDGPFDAVFSCHVLEHVPRPSDVCRWAMNLLAPRGIFVAVTPNGSHAFLQADAKAFHRHWGMVHPYYLDQDFYKHQFGAHAKLMASAPIDHLALRDWNGSSDRTLDLSGWELLVAVVNDPRH